MDILTNKSYKSYDYFSRYENVPYFYNKEDNKYIYGTTFQLNQSTPYIIHIVKTGDTLDNIALEAYNNPTYYYLIADFNNIQNPYLPLKEGDRLKIPTFSAVSYKE